MATYGSNLARIDDCKADSIPAFESEHEQSDPLIFLHIYKTGGTTLNRILEREYKLHQICSVDPNGWQWHYRKILRWPERRLNRTLVFKGHMPFGLHDVLRRRARYLTILRDPVERAVSDYYFARSFAPHINHRVAQQLTLEEYFLEKHEHNLQTQIIAGPSAENSFAIPCGPVTAYTRLRGSYLRYSINHKSEMCDDATLDRAKKNLARHFEVVGLTDRYEETLALLKVTFGWKVRRYGRFRTTPNRLPKDRVPGATAELIRKRERFDVALYAYAQDLFEKLLAERHREVQKALATIRAARTSTTESRYYFYSSIIRAALSRLYSSLSFSSPNRRPDVRH